MYWERCRGELWLCFWAQVSNLASYCTCACISRQHVTDATKATQGRQRGREERAIKAGDREGIMWDEPPRSGGRWWHQRWTPAASGEQAKEERRKRVQAFLPSTQAQIKDSYRTVGSMSGKVTLARTLKLIAFCGVVAGREKRGSPETKWRPRLQMTGKGLASEGKCLCTKGIHGQHMSIEIKCIKVGQPPQDCW